MKYVISMDIGGTSVKYAIVDQNGRMSSPGSFPTHAMLGGESLMLRLIQRAQTLAEDLDPDDIIGVAISTAGNVTADHSTVAYAANLPGWTGMPLSRRMRQSTGFTCYVENDVNAAALGERWLGAAKDSRMLVMLTLGTGVGGAAIANGQLLTGSRGIAGEFGHVLIHPGGRRCGCGCLGCLEAYASTSALNRLIAERLGADEPDPVAFFADCTSGDPAALTVLDEWLTELCYGLASLVHCYNPDTVLIGGGVSRQGDFLIDRLTPLLKPLVTPTFLEGLTVATASLFNDAGLLGAANALFTHENW